LEKNENNLKSIMILHAGEYINLDNDTTDRIKMQFFNTQKKNEAGLLSLFA